MQERQRAIMFLRGGLAEWLKAAVLKTAELKGSVGSNPTSSAISLSREQVLMSYRICVEDVQKRNMYQIFPNHECPQVFREWAKDQLGLALTDEHPEFGASDRNFKAYPVEDLQSLLECVETYVQDYIASRTPEQWDYAKSVYGHIYKSLPLHELPSWQMTQEIRSGIVWTTSNLVQYLLDNNIARYDFITRRWVYLDGKKLYIHGY